MLDLAEYVRFLITLLAILDPFAAIPMFLALTAGQSPVDREWTARAAALTVVAVLLGAALTGETFLILVGASLASFQVGGGIVLLLMALSMLEARVSRVRQTDSEVEEAESRRSVGAVPIGLPLLAGPGSISAVIIERKQAEGFGHLVAITLVILLISAAVYIALRLAGPIGAKLGTIGLNILNRLFGLLLAAIAISTIAAGLKALFPALG
jgi:multiple antibiotic resistance protein